MDRRNQAYIEETKSIKKSISNAFLSAILIASFVLICAAVLFAGHLSEYFHCVSNNIEHCSPNFASLRLNEWGDYFAGVGATLALIFLGIGLFIQMKELALQRLEMAESRIEQSKAAEELRRARELEGTIALFQYAQEKVNVIPVISAQLTGKGFFIDGKAVTFRNHSDHRAHFERYYWSNQDKRTIAEGGLDIILNQRDEASFSFQLNETQQTLITGSTILMLIFRDELYLQHKMTFEFRNGAHSPVTGKVHKLDNIIGEKDNLHLELTAIRHS